MVSLVKMFSPGEATAGRKVSTQDLDTDRMQVLIFGKAVSSDQPWCIVSFVQEDDVRTIRYVCYQIG